MEKTLQSLCKFLLRGLFFCFVELSASLPRIEIIGKDDYFRFSVRDSLALEASFLQVSITKSH